MQLLRWVAGHRSCGAARGNGRGLWPVQPPVPVPNHAELHQMVQVLLHQLHGLGDAG